MKTYRSEEEFVTMFAKHVNEGEKQFEVNGKTFSVDGKYQNSSKAAVYHVTINGELKKWTIVQLKKYLNVEYKKEYNRTSERAVSAGTKVAIKTDEELIKTAESEYERYKKAFETVQAFASKYCLSYPSDNKLTVTAFTDAYAIIHPDENDKDSIVSYILNELKEDRDKLIAEKQAREEKAARERAEKVETVTELTAELQKALADGNLTKVAEISAKLAKAAK